MATFDDVFAQASHQAERIDSLMTIVDSLSRTMEHLRTELRPEIAQAIEALHQQLDVNNVKLSALHDALAGHVDAPPTAPEAPAAAAPAPAGA